MYIKHALQGQKTCDSIDISIKKKDRLNHFCIGNPISLEIRYTLSLLFTWEKCFALNLIAILKV